MKFVYMGCYTQVIYFLYNEYLYTLKICTGKSKGLRLLDMYAKRVKNSNEIFILLKISHI